MTSTAGADRTASQRGRANRRQGRETERAVRDHLRQWWPTIDYYHPGGHTRTHADDCGDLGPCIDRDGDHWTIEVKGPRATPPAGQIDRWATETETEADRAGMGGLWVLVVRRPGCADVGSWHAYQPAAQLFDQLEGGDARFDLVGLTVRSWVGLTAP